MTRRRANRAVYTALLGGYEALVEQPVARESSFTFICFTDDPELTSTTWDVRLIQPALPDDLVRSCRILKIRGHDLLGSFDETLWIDNAVRLRQDPALFVDAWLAHSDLAIPAHSYRSTIAAEFDAVLATGRDDPSRVGEQLATYTAHNAERLERQVFWTALLARRPSDITRRTMQVWLDHVLRYSRRDQLSIAHALAETGQAVSVIDIDNMSSEWHEWPVADGRVPVAQDFPPRWPIDSDHERLARLRGQIDEVTTQFNRAVIEREVAIQQLQSSTSWRLTSPLRTASDAVRKGLSRLHRRVRRR